MKLSEWLKREGISGAEFARRAGLSEGTISLLTRDATWPTRDTAETITRVTNGEVTPNDFFFDRKEAAQ